MKRTTNEAKIGGGFAEMEDDAPVELEPAKVGLQDGTVGGVDAVVERSDQHGAGVFDDETGHRDAWMTEHRAGWIETDFVPRGLKRGADQAFPSGLPIAKAGFVQTLANGLEDAGGQRGVADEVRRLVFGKTCGVRTIKETFPDQALLAEIHQQTCAKPPELAVAEDLNQMLGGKLPTQSFQFRDEMILDHKIRLECVRNDPSIHEVTPWFGKMRNTIRCESHDKLLMMNLLIQP